MSNVVLYSGLVLAAGASIPVMAALNASLGAALHNPNAAAVILFLVALFCSVLALCLGGAPAAGRLTGAPPHTYLAGVLVAFYILGVTRAAPTMGIANMVLFVLLGQLVSAAVIDHFGLLNAVRAPLSLRRLIGLLFVLIGILLARRPG